MLIVVGVLGLAWTVTVWRWQDPFTGLYTRWEQHRLGQQYDRLVSRWRPPRGTVAPRDAAAARRDVARAAAVYRHETHPGQAIGRIVIGRIGLNMVLVDGTDHESLKRGPGRDLRTYMPGQNRLIYIAAHGPHGSFTPITSCRQWRTAVDAGRFRYLVTTPERDFWRPTRLRAAPEARWTRTDPGARLLFTRHAGGQAISVFELRHRLDPAGCR